MRRAAFVLASALALGLSTAIVPAPAEAAVIPQTVRNSGASDRGLVVSWSFGHLPGSTRIVKIGTTSPYHPTRSWYVPRGCTAKRTASPRTYKGNQWYMEFATVGTYTIKLRCIGKQGSW